MSRKKKSASSGDNNEQELTPEQIRELVQCLERIERLEKIVSAMEEYISMLAQYEYKDKEEEQDD